MEPIPSQTPSVPWYLVPTPAELSDPDSRARRDDCGWAKANLAAALADYCGRAGAGSVFGPEKGYACVAGRPDKVLCPSLSFVAAGRDGAATPDFVAEVVAPGDRAMELHSRMVWWTRGAGARHWVVWPHRHQVEVFERDGSSIRRISSDTLTIPDVLPGFSLAVAELFREPVADPAVIVDGGDQ